ncbi:MAG: cyclic nucleotide-binding domain-containing protein [Hyphomicrobium sp.]|uniref:cyclic nucleotide-binding domain-containing protein n=1 Tax=Hyphomicrobium sp. TaxID=82 RepID=UPI0039E37EC5
MALKPDPADLLARTPLFGTLDEPSRKAVAAELREFAYEPGQIIFSRGQTGSELHIVTKGRVRLSVLTADGRELSFAHVEPPSIFGELAVFDGRPRSADATAVNKVETLMLSKSAFVRLLST